MLSIYKGICLLTSVLCLFGEASADALGDLQTKGRTAINTQLAKSTTCTAAKLQVRKEWYASSQSAVDSSIHLAN
jgi:tyrosinase